MLSTENPVARTAGKFCFFVCLLGLIFCYLDFILCLFVWLDILFVCLLCLLGFIFNFVCLFVRLDVLFQAGALLWISHPERRKKDL